MNPLLSSLFQGISSMMLDYKIIHWWERGKVLGVGSSGFVSEARPRPWTGFYNLFPPLMAVKSSKIKDNIDNEMQILSRLRGHPHIIHLYLYDVTMEQGTVLYNIFLEYASGGSLADRINSNGGGLSEFEVSGYVKGILLGLDTIHELGFVHCDVKPENILIVNGVAKIADFGLTVKAGVYDNRHGTLEYVAPEVVRDINYTSRADIWALGLTVLTMLTGNCIWDSGIKSLEMLDLIGYSNVLPVIPKGLSIEAVDFLSKCLVRNHELRWTAKMLLDHPFVKMQMHRFRCLPVPLDYAIDVSMMKRKTYGPDALVDVGW
ncbi:mitogen-activated protein kinase kinase kinase 20-like [Impatiens glandulifera]|uniref:mitogen-activated protein kinase kinase kinase 20-like n=1 Tax=Impatiens glandulifera TaxID=253017 RepID=UPI001FB19243|nr:mitogen-activated protein kinase kinase kinase 20-like [Impatiens glandulifera]